MVCPVIGVYCGTSGYACTGNEEEDAEMTTIGPNPREIYAREMEMIEVDISKYVSQVDLLLPMFL